MITPCPTVALSKPRVEPRADLVCDGVSHRIHEYGPRVKEQWSAPVPCPRAATAAMPGDPFMSCLVAIYDEGGPW